MAGPKPWNVVHTECVADCRMFFSIESASWVNVVARIRAGEVDHGLVLTALYWLHLDEHGR